MRTFLPLFPLQIVAFPGEEVNLHVFEPRYRELMKDCEAEGITFGLIAYIDGKVQEYGTELELTSVEKRYPDGKLDVRTRGLGTFRLYEFYNKAPGKLYAGGRIERLEDHTKGDFLKNEKILELLEQFFESLRISKSIPDNNEDFRTFDVAHHVGFSLEEEYDFLQIRNERERQEAIISHLEKMLPVVREMEELRRKVQMNGHFKNIIPPDV